MNNNVTNNEKCPFKAYISCICKKIGHWFIIKGPTVLSGLGNFVHIISNLVLYVPLVNNNVINNEKCTFKAYNIFHVCVKKLVICSL